MANDERQETVEAVLNDILSWADDLQRVSPSVPSPGAQALREFVDRIRTALKLERESVTKCNGFGNAAAMREACANIVEYARSARCHTEDAHVMYFLYGIEGWARSAITAPARNCDKMPDIDNLTMHDLAKSPCKSTLEYASREELLALVRWLLAPAAEKGAGE